MIIYFDENMPLHLAQGFQILQAAEGLKTGYPLEVRYIPTEFERGVKDEIWIPQLGRENACVITQDVNISRRKQELALYRHHKIGAFFSEVLVKNKVYPYGKWCKHSPKIGLALAKLYIKKSDLLGILFRYIGG